MRAPFDFVIEPKGNRYNNTTKVGNKNLILNTEVYNHQFVNRQAIVKSVPTAFESEIKPKDEVIVHHNVFRRWHNMRGEEKNSRSFFDEETYFISEEQIFLYKSEDTDWRASKGYCFVKPIVSKDDLDTNIRLKNNNLLNTSVSVVNPNIIKNLIDKIISINLKLDNMPTNSVMTKEEFARYLINNPDAIAAISSQLLNKDGTYGGSVTSMGMNS